MITPAALKAKNVLTTLGIDDPASIAIEDLIIYHDGTVKELPLYNCEGRLVMKNGRSIVTVNSNIEYAAKKRYVLAHELGHILLHADKEVTFSDDYMTLEAYKHGSQEKEANDFAAELLMPTELFQKACYRQKFGFDLLVSLSEKFNTSLTSTVYKYIDAGPHPICAFFSKDRKVQYSKRSTNFPYWIQDISKLNVPAHSVAEEFYSKNRIYQKKDADQEIVKSTWFELKELDQDTQMFEFCVITKKYNTVLSVVWER